MGAPRFDGHIDRIADGWLLGWAWNAAEPDAAITVDVAVDGTHVASALANRYRPDLVQAGIGNGHHAFEVALPADIPEGVHDVSVRYHGSAVEVFGSPFAYFVGVAEPRADTNPMPGYRSRFGGLWTDLDNALEVVEGKLALGWITDDEAAHLRHWITHGFLLLPSAVSADVIDALDQHVENIWSGTSPEPVFVEDWDNNVHTIQRAGPRFRNRRVKLLDLIGHSEAAQALAFSPAILRFLTLIFEAPAHAFQSLYFRWGSKQDMHQDSAFVRVSSPLAFAASWIALQDVEERSGELEYYPGSHHFDDYLFEGQRKWMPLRSPEYDAFVASLHSRATERGLARQRFLPRKGDVLLWAADLAHGGSQDVREGITRKSLVTHYCPLTCRPIDAGGRARTDVRQHSAQAFSSCVVRD